MITGTSTRSLRSWGKLHLSHTPKSIFKNEKDVAFQIKFFCDKIYSNTKPDSTFNTQTGHLVDVNRLRFCSSFTAQPLMQRLIFTQIVNVMPPKWSYGCESHVKIYKFLNSRDIYQIKNFGGHSVIKKHLHHFWSSLKGNGYSVIPNPER